jgi:hypothetical protein
LENLPCQGGQWGGTNCCFLYSDLPEGPYICLAFLLIALTPLQNVENKFPNLFCLTMDILPRQASPVPSEHLLLPEKETFTTHWNKIWPGLVEALQVLNISPHRSLLNLMEYCQEMCFSNTFKLISFS